MLRTDIEAVNITDGVYLLKEPNGTNCYLVVGSHKAMLIDCGLGFSDMKGAVEKITRLPLTVVITHGHVDHFGGAWQFPEIYLHKDDCKLLNDIQRSYLIRKMFLKGAQGAAETKVSFAEFKNKPKPKIVKLNGDERFDLGGKLIRIRHTVGHTWGSVAVIDETDKIISSGDNVCDALWMMLPGSSSIEEWLPSAEWLYEMSKSYSVYWGHRTPKLETQYILQVINWGREILALYKTNSKFSKIRQYPERSDGIIFRTGNVRKKERYK